MRIAVLLALLLPLVCWSEEKVQTEEMIGRFGGRSALLYLHSRQRADGSARRR